LDYFEISLKSRGFFPIQRSRRGLRSACPRAGGEGREEEADGEPFLERHMGGLSCWNAAV
jgi:hypothetical protein